MANTSSRPPTVQSKRQKPLNLDFCQTPPDPSHRQKQGKKNLFTPGDGDIHCMTRSSTQPPQPKVPDINHPCACRLNSHPQTTRDSEKYCTHIDPHPSQGLCDEVCDIQTGQQRPWLSEKQPSRPQTHRKTTTTSTTPMRPRTPAGPPAGTTMGPPKATPLSQLQRSPSTWGDLRKNEKHSD